MADGEWLWKLAGVVTPLLTGIVGLFGGLYSAGRNSAQREQKIKDEFRAEMTAHKNHTEETKDALVEQFKESFAGLRQKINDVELDAQKTFVSKDDFKDFREEYRDDMRDLKALIVARSQ